MTKWDNALQRCSLIFVNTRISNTGKIVRKVSKCLETIDWSHIQVKQGNFHLEILEMEILCKEIFGLLHSMEEYKFYFDNLRRPLLMANMAKKLFLWKLDVKKKKLFLSNQKHLMVIHKLHKSAAAAPMYLIMDLLSFHWMWLMISTSNHLMQKAESASLLKIPKKLVYPSQ